MDYKTILVHIDHGRRCAERVELAVRLAEQTGAHLVGMYALSALRVPPYALTAPGGMLLEAIEQNNERSEHEARVVFDALVKRQVAVQLEWRSSHEDAVDAVQLSARYSDLVVVGQHDPYAEEDSGTDADFVDEVVTSVCRPVLVVPYAGKFDGVGRKILVSWNASSPAARAITAALPLLRRADEVRVAVFDARQTGFDHGEVPGADLALYLARHGVKASVTQQESPYGDVGCGILSRAADFGSDLIVMGAYGHSRTRERVLGGATRTLLDSMTVPVLMAH
jgi:nucleotide-binding universal stress UspA family protein